MRILNVDLETPSSKEITKALLMWLVMAAFCIGITILASLPMNGLFNLLCGILVGVGTAMVGIDLKKGWDHIKLFALIVIVFIATSAVLQFLL